MTRILLIRHARTELLGRVLYGRLPGIVLSEEGYRQAEALADTMHARYKVSRVISSPLERAMETARRIADLQRVPLETNDSFTELDLGSWVGKPYEDLQEDEDWKEYNQLRSMRCAPGGESMLEVQARAWAGLEKLRSQHTGETVAVVSHGDVIRGILVLALGMSLDNILRFQIAPASLSEVVLEPWGPVVRSLNQTFEPGTD
jgi:broad specificity phosphatase PhoE